MCAVASQAVRRALLYAAAFLGYLLTTACTSSSGYGPVNSAYFERNVEQSLAPLSVGDIQESLRSNWIPHKQKDSIRGVFTITAKGLVFASWDRSQGLYRAKYRVPYRRLNAVRIEDEKFRKKLRVEMQGGRVDNFEILSQGPRPPYVVNNDLTEDTFELLKQIRQGLVSKQRRSAVEEVDFKALQRERPRRKRMIRKGDY